MGIRANLALYFSILAVMIAPRGKAHIILISALDVRGYDALPLIHAAEEQKGWI